MATSKFAQAPKAARTRTARAAEQVVDQVNEEAVTQDTVFTRFTAAQDDLLKSLGVPSGHRALAGLVVGCLASFVTGYIGSSLIQMATLVVVATTGSAVLSLLVWLLGIAITMYSSVVVGNAVGRYITSAKCDKHYNTAKDLAVSARNTVASWFSRSAVAA